MHVYCVIMEFRVFLLRFLVKVNLQHWKWSYWHCGTGVCTQVYCTSFVSKPFLLLNEIFISLKFSLMRLWSWAVPIRCSCLENGDQATCVLQDMGCVFCLQSDMQFDLKAHNLNFAHFLRFEGASYGAQTFTLMTRTL